MQWEVETENNMVAFRRRDEPVDTASANVNTKHSLCQKMPSSSP